jgi:hypothetical protein
MSNITPKSFIRMITGLMFVRKAAAYASEIPYRQGRLLVLPANIRLGRKHITTSVSAPF